MDGGGAIRMDFTSGIPLSSDTSVRLWQAYTFLPSPTPTHTELLILWLSWSKRDQECWEETWGALSKQPCGETPWWSLLLLK